MKFNPKLWICRVDVDFIMTPSVKVKFLMRIESAIPVLLITIMSCISLLQLYCLFKLSRYISRPWLGKYPYLGRSLFYGRLSRLAFSKDFQDSLCALQNVSSMSAMTIFQEKKMIFVCRLLQIYFLEATVISWYLPLALYVHLCNKKIVTVTQVCRVLYKI